MLLPMLINIITNSNNYNASMYEVTILNLRACYERVHIVHDYKYTINRLIWPQSPGHILLTLQLARPLRAEKD